MKLAIYIDDYLGFALDGIQVFKQEHHNNFSVKWDIIQYFCGEYETYFLNVDILENEIEVALAGSSEYVSYEGNGINKVHIKLDDEIVYSFG